MTTKETKITCRAKAFAGRLENIRCIVDATGTIRVWDSVAGHYTTCHGLSDSAQRRIRKLAEK